MDRNLEMFIGCESEYAQSDIVLFGAPYDSTTSYRPGSRFASKAIRSESFGLETYSPYQDKDLSEIKVFDFGDLELPFGNSKKMIDQIDSFVTEVSADEKIPFMIGGEHLVTLGAVQALSRKYDDLHIIHFDAHADVRNNYLGETLSHACVMRRCWELVGDKKIYQFGIRSGEKEEFLWSKEHLTLTKFNFDGIKDTADKIIGKNIYLSIDLDVLDPSILPGTGTPEAGGVSFKELLDACLALSELNIVGVDVNELAPIYDQSGASTTTACKLIRELLFIIGDKKRTLI